MKFIPSIAISVLLILFVMLMDSCGTEKPQVKNNVEANDPPQQKKPDPVTHTFSDKILDLCTQYNSCETTILVRQKDQEVEIMFEMESTPGEITIYRDDEKGSKMVTMNCQGDFTYENIPIGRFPDGKYLCLVKRGDKTSRVDFLLVTN